MYSCVELRKGSGGGRVAWVFSDICEIHGHCLMLLSEIRKEEHTDFDDFSGGKDRKGISGQKRTLDAPNAYDHIAIIGTVRIIDS